MQRYKARVISDYYFYWTAGKRSTVLSSPSLPLLGWMGGWIELWSIGINVGWCGERRDMLLWGLWHAWITNINDVWIWFITIISARLCALLFLQVDSGTMLTGDESQNTRSVFVIFFSGVTKKLVYLFCGLFKLDRDDRHNNLQAFWIQFRNSRHSGWLRD